MTMRSDFLGDCDNFYRLPEAMNRSQYLVPRLTRQQRQQAIEGPILLFNRTITPRLLNLVLNDAGEQSDQLPVMQHALMRTWENWEHSGDPEIDLKHYEAVGTISKALSKDADAVLEGMSEDELKVTEQVFQALVDTDKRNRRVRRPVHLSELEAITGTSRVSILGVIKRFHGSGRLFLTFTDDNDPFIDISHESLIRQWETLQVWLDKEAESRDIYLRLADVAERYEKGLAGLMRNPELQLALDWREKNSPNEVWAQRYHPAFSRAMSFLDKSAQKRKLRRLLGALVIVVALALALALVVAKGHNLYNEAQNAKILATNERIVAIRESARADIARQQADQNFTEILKDGVKLEMVKIPGGTFVMGSPDTENGRLDQEGPQHEVKIEPFFIGKYEVTQAQWKSVMSYNPNRIEGNLKGDVLPVVHVTWGDAKMFCQNLSKMTGRGYRLPSEAEWEYAARAGSTGAYCFGDNENLLDEYAWYDKNSDGKTHPVGQLKPNNWGLYDMHGNIYEWCLDLWHKNYDGAPTNGSAWVDGGEQDKRVLRGGTWYNSRVLSRVSSRLFGYYPQGHDYKVGFRVVATRSR
jgi:formylglycine-generating enzyme required for sulfatase activity